MILPATELRVVAYDVSAYDVGLPVRSGKLFAVDKWMNRLCNKL